MTGSELSDEQQVMVAQVAERYELDLVILFGSYARGGARSDSDVDIAVHTCREDFGRRDSDAEAWWEMDLFAALNAAIPAPEGIDLVVLNRADSVLLFEVARNGLVLYQREPLIIHQFRSYAARRFDDDARFRRRGWEYLKRRCLGGQGPDRGSTTKTAESAPVSR